MKQKLDCSIVQDLLPGYVDHVTSQETNRQVEEHLAGCESCRKAYEDMKTPETFAPATREIKYLKKIHRTVIGIIAVAAIACCAILGAARGYFSETTSARAYAYEVHASQPGLTVQVFPYEEGDAIRHVEMKRESDTVELSVRIGRQGWRTSATHTWQLPEDVKKITLNGTTIYEDGVVVSRAAAMVFAKKTPFVGNASAVSALLWEIGVNYGKFELFTDQEPYGMRVYAEKEPGELAAALLLAGIDNLSYVQFNASETKYDSAHFREKYAIDVKKLGKTSSGIQQIIDTLE